MHELPDTLQAFLEPAFYPHPVEKIELLQTHISWVFLTGDFAYKLKKPVNFGFLDFSTLEKRKYYCDEELRLNRRLAPELYLDVFPVGMTARGPRLGEPDHIVDYCLKMRQFEQGNLLSSRLEHGDFQDSWMDIIAGEIAHFHEAVAGEASRSYGRPETLFGHIRDNLEVAQDHRERGIDATTLERLKRFAERKAESAGSLLAARQQAGHVRPCHGDLHLRNIALVDGHPRAFDCIEFNPEYRVIDTMNDAAFLLMDCAARGRTDLGMRFLSRYLESGGDYAGLQLLQLYLFYRATVRGKVACLLAGELSDGQAQARQFDEARHYFSLAAEYTAPLQPRLFMVGGLSGSGKSHLALAGCGIERAIVIRSDATRKRIALAHSDLPLYGEPMNRLTYDAMRDAARTALQAGWPVILDATFMQRHQRDRMRELAAETGVDVHPYWLDLPAETLRERIRSRSAAGQDISDADLAVLETQLAGYQRPGENDIVFLKDSSTWPRKRPY